MILPPAGTYPKCFPAPCFSPCFIYLFILAALGLCCSVQAPHCDIWASLAALPRLRCHTACGILVPRPGIELASPALKGGFLITRPPGESVHCVLNLLNKLLD